MTRQMLLVGLTLSIMIASFHVRPAGAQPATQPANESTLQNRIDALERKVALLENRVVMLEKPPSQIQKSERGIGARGARNTSVSRKHWIKKIEGDGSLIILDDNSIWEVDRLERITTSLWLPISDVLLMETEFNGVVLHRLMNLDDREDVDVTFKGHMVP